MSSGALLLAALTSTQATAPAPRVDLVTIGVGEAMYAVFGHAALRVVHPDGTDTAYNFGGVDMQQPNFWTRLMQGRVEAYLKVTPYSDLLLEYSAEDRSIVGRTLDLPPDVAQAVVADLERIAASDEERTYLYHHIFDNCTTRVATLLDRRLDGKLKKAGSYPVRGTHRDWILDRIRWKPWVYLAMDLAGNGAGDVPLVAWDTIFIPEGLDRIIDGASFEGRPLVKAKYLEYRSLTYSDPPLWDWPWIKVYVLFVFPLLLLIAWRPTWGAKVWGVAAGAMGLIYVLFWLFSEYDFYHANANNLLFLPTHFLLLVGRTRRPYAIAHFAFTLVVLVLSWTGVIVQAIGPMLALVIPIEGLLVYRLWRR